MAKRKYLIIFTAFSLLFLALAQIEAYAAFKTHDNIARLFLRYNNKIGLKHALFLSRIVHREGDKHNLHPYVIAAVIVRESGVRSRVVSKTGDYGLMQIHLNAHRKKIKSVEDLFNPEINIALGSRILADCIRHSKTLRGALIRYSGGNKTMAERVLRTLREMGYQP